MESSRVTDRSKSFMDAVWDANKNGADTEEKLVAAVLKIAAERVTFYNAQNNLIVLDKNDLLQLAGELEQ